MPRRKLNDLDPAKGAIVLVLLVGFTIYHFRQQILDALGGLAFILPIPLLLLSAGCFFFRKKLRASSNQSPGGPHPATHVHVTHYPSPSPEVSFAPPTAHRSRPPAPPKSEPEPVHTSFTPELLKKLEWRSFEKLIEALFRTMNMQAERLRAGADGGVDLVLRNKETGLVEGLVQCKAWNTYAVGVKPIRELFGVMHAEGAPQGYFVCTGEYTREALEWAQLKPLTLINGGQLLEWLNSLPEETIHSLLSGILASDYTTPTCPTCDKKLVHRTSKHGDFWGCSSFPRCRYTMKIVAS
jgi:restriction system protein